MSGAPGPAEALLGLGGFRARGQKPHPDGLHVRRLRRRRGEGPSRRRAALRPLRRPLGRPAGRAARAGCPAGVRPHRPRRHEASCIPARGGLRPASWSSWRRWTSPSEKASSSPCSALTTRRCASCSPSCGPTQRPTWPVATGSPIRTGGARCWVATYLAAHSPASGAVEGQAGGGRGGPSILVIAWHLLSTGETYTDDYFNEGGTSTAREHAWSPNSKPWATELPSNPSLTTPATVGSAPTQKSSRRALVVAPGAVHITPQRPVIRTPSPKGALRGWRSKHATDLRAVALPPNTAVEHEHPPGSKGGPGSGCVSFRTRPNSFSGSSRKRLPTSVGGDRAADARPDGRC